MSSLEYCKPYKHTCACAHVCLAALQFFREFPVFLTKDGSYENTPMQHTAIFHYCINDNFQLKFLNYFNIFAQNIDFGYTLEVRRF